MNIVLTDKISDYKDIVGRIHLISLCIKVFFLLYLHL